MFKVDVKYIQSPNYISRRNNKKIIAIVDHITAGSADGALSWLCNPSSQASAHYLVTKAGQIFQLVNDEDTAWHAGIVNQPNWPLYDGTNPNRYTIGIEHECLSGGELTEAQYQATLELHRQLIAKFGISIDQDHIIGHYRIDSVNRPNCPGPNFPWERLFADLSKPQVIAVNIQFKGNIMQGIAVDNHSYAPVRELATLIGRSVQWDANTNTALVLPVTIPIVPTSYVKVVVGSTVLEVQVLDQKTYAPVRAFAEALGYKVTWDALSNSVVIV